MTMLHDRPPHEREVHEVIVRDQNSGGGMGMGVILGIIVTLLIAGGLLLMTLGNSMSGTNTGATPADGSAPTINVNPPDIQVPDRITIDTPQLQPGGSNSAPSNSGNAPAGGSSQPNSGGSTNPAPDSSGSGSGQ